MTVRDEADKAMVLRELLEVVPLAAMRVNDGGIVVAVNTAWEALSGQDEQASLGTGWTRVVIDGEALREELARAAASRTSGSRDHPLYVDGQPSWTRWWWRPVADEGLVVGVASIDADKEREQQLWFRATHDPLTKLTNRSEFVTVLERALHRGQRREQPPAVIYIDLDGFKAVNDDGGHQLGDQVLRSVARRLSDAVRPADVPARVGGDEFAVVCEDLSSAEDAEHLADRIRDAIELPVVVGTRTVDVHATTGVAFAAAGDGPESLLGRADLDMYAAKHRSAPTVAGAGAATAVVPSGTRSPGTRDCNGPTLGDDDAVEQPLHLGNWWVNRVFQLSLDLHVAATQDGHSCELFGSLVEKLDRLIVDVQLAVFASAHHSERQAADPATEITRASEALDAALDHLGEAWTTVVTSGDEPALGDRLIHAAHLTQSATRVLTTDSLY